MKYQKTINLLDATSYDNIPRFITKKMDRSS